MSAGRLLRRESVSRSHGIHVIDKESLKIKMLEQVLIEKVCQLFQNLL